MHIFRFWVDFAPKRVRDLIRYLSVNLTTGSRMSGIVGLHAVREDGLSHVYRHHKCMIILAPSEHRFVLLTCSDQAV